MMKIGIFTASTPIGSLFPQRAERAIKFLEAKGHQVVKGELFDQNQGYRSGNIQSRVQEINKLISAKVDVLLSAIGGWDTNSILPYLDYQKINEQKLIVCGFSDTTAFLSAVSQFCPRARVIYGPALFPNFGEFEEESRDISYDNFLKLIENQPVCLQAKGQIYTSSENWENFEKPRKTELNEWKIWNPQKIKQVSGKLFGGNGETMLGILGSDYSQKIISEGILVIEDTQINAAKMERIFSALLLSNFFKKTKAIILGKCNGYPKNESEPVEILKEILNIARLEIPIIYDVNVSHVKPMLALELKKETTIDFEKKQIFQN